MFGDDPGRQLLGGHFEREETDDAAVRGLDHPVATRSRLVDPGDVERDVGRERSFAHARTTSEDHEIGGLQAAHVSVEIGKARCNAAKGTVALVSLRRHVDGGRQRLGKAPEAPVVPPRLRNLVEAPLRLLDLIAGTRIDRRIEGDVNDILADRDQLAPHREIVNAAPVIVGVDDGGRLAGKAGQILRHGHAAEIMFAEKSLERHRRRQLASPDQRSRDLENAAMNLLDEVLASEEVRDAIKCIVVDEDRPEQGLLGLEVVRRRAIGPFLRRRLALQQFVEGRHGAVRVSLSGVSRTHVSRESEMILVRGPRR